MQPTDVLTQLRSLNWLREEAECFPVGSMLRRLLEGQQEVVRHRLPADVWAQCKKSIAAGRPSLTTMQRSRCGACHEHLPDTLVKELKLSAQFAICPHCGTYLCAPLGSERSRRLRSPVEAGHA